MADEGRLFKLEVITPNEEFYNGEVVMVEFNTQEGDIGVYKGHIPLTTVLAPGILTITTDTGKEQATLMTGFAEILPNHVRILAEAAEWPDKIDAQRAEAAKERAQQRLSSHDAGVDVARAELALSKALVRLGMEKR